MEILELRLQTNNLLETKKFYQEVIGFEKIDETNNAISFCVGASKLIFDSIDSEQCPTYHFAFNIPTNKIQEALEWTLQRTNLIADDNSFVIDFENWNAKAIYFFDNNQNILEFICRRDLNNHTDEAFLLATILSINEIGLVHDQPLEIGREIIEKTKIDFFAKGPKREDFAALGDEEGLFVISNPNRNWYPTQHRAIKCKVKAKIKVSENEYELEFN